MPECCGIHKAAVPQWKYTATPMLSYFSQKKGSKKGIQEENIGNDGKQKRREEKRRKWRKTGESEARKEY